MRVRFTITDMIGAYIKNNNQRKQEIGAVHERECREYEKMVREHPDDSENRAGTINILVDDLMKKSLEKNGPASCKKGCSFCCYQQVMITDDEADLLLRCVAEIDWAKVERQAKAKRWRDLSREDRSCIFLVDDKCFPYEHRPSTCRKYFSIEDPKKCDTETNPNGEVKRLVSIGAEVVVSSAWTVRDSDTMPKMLLKRRGKRRGPTNKNETR
jgi:Fe-S-cluster containining protein